MFGSGRARLAVVAALMFGVAVGAPSAAVAETESASLPAEWDGLVRARSSRIDAVYLLPGADFREYTKIMIDEPEVAVDQRWLRNFNRSSSTRLSDSDVQRGIENVRSGFRESFTRRFANAGFAVVTTPGPDVMRIRPAVINIQVTAPDTRSASRSQTFARETGRATMVLELRDSVTNALLGRAVDSRTIGDSGFARARNSVTNTSDFRREFDRWADASIQGFEALLENSPFNPEPTKP